MKLRLAMLFLCAFPLHAQTFVGQVTTRSFGAEGSVTANKTPMLPAYVSAFTPQGTTIYTWGDGVTTWYSPTSESFVITFSDTNPHNVTLFADDDDSTARVETVQAGASTQKISNFHGGTYLTYTVTGSVTFKITANAGANAVLTSVFFDPSAGSPICPVPKVNLFWQASTSSVSGYEVFQNGANITPTPITTTSYSVGGLKSGTYSFTIEAIGTNGQSTMSTPIPVVVQ